MPFEVFGGVKQCDDTFRNDYIGATSFSQAELVGSINFTTHFHPALKFNWTISELSPFT